MDRRSLFRSESEEQTIGVLVLHAAEDDAFDASELALLRDVADEIGFGIGSLRLRAKHSQAEAQVLASERRLRETFEQAAVGITRVDLRRPDRGREREVLPAPRLRQGRARWAVRERIEPSGRLRSRLSPARPGSRAAPAARWSARNVPPQGRKRGLDAPHDVGRLRRCRPGPAHHQHRRGHQRKHGSSSAASS